MSTWRAWRSGRRLLRGYSMGRTVTAPPLMGWAGGGEAVTGAIIVSKAGSNTTGDGTLDAPYRSLQFAAAGAKAGDTIYLRGGYYDVVGVDTYVSINTSGSELAPVTVRSYPGEWAIIDGINHPNHPRSAGDGLPDKTPYVITSSGSWINWSDLEERNGQGGGWSDNSTNCTFTNMVFRNNNAQALMITGEHTTVGYCLAQDTYNRVLGGNGGDGFLTAGDSRYNRLHHCISNMTSDDGLTLATARDTIMEYCIAMNAGVVPEEQGSSTTGMGTGFKMGLSDTVNSGNIVRYCIAMNNGGRGYNSNTSQGITAHNNLSFGDNGGFTLVAFGTPNKGDNAAFNNLVVDMNGGNVRVLDDDVTTHTHNAGSTAGWANGTNGVSNLTLTAGELAFLSKDSTNADFAKLGEASLARGHGIVIEKATDVDLGPIPYGEEFAGGWDWRALLAAHPSVRQWPMPQD